MTEPRAVPPKPVSVDFATPEAINFAFTETFRRMQSKNHRIFSEIPKEHEVSEGEIVFFDNESGTSRLYVKLNGSLFYVNLS